MCWPTGANRKSALRQCFSRCAMKPTNWGFMNREAECLTPWSFATQTSSTEKTGTFIWSATTIWRTLYDLYPQFVVFGFLEWNSGKMYFLIKYKLRSQTYG